MAVNTNSIFWKGSQNQLVLGKLQQFYLGTLGFSKTYGIVENTYKNIGKIFNLRGA